MLRFAEISVKPIGNNKMNLVAMLIESQFQVKLEGLFTLQDKINIKNSFKNNKNKWLLWMECARRIAFWTIHDLTHKFKRYNINRYPTTDNNVQYILDKRINNPELELYNSFVVYIFQLFALPSIFFHSEHTSATMQSYTVIKAQQTRYFKWD